MREKESGIRRKNNKRTPVTLVIRVGDGEIARIELQDSSAYLGNAKNLEQVVRKIVREEMRLNAKKLQRDVGQCPLGV